MTSIATFNDTATVGLATAWDIIDTWEASAPSATPKKVWGICNASVAGQFNLGYPYLLWQATSNPCTATPSGSGGAVSLASETELAATGTNDSQSLFLLSSAGMLMLFGGVLLWVRRRTR
jgi:LPXTG-motif cell wall-anchored protein